MTSRRALRAALTAARAEADRQRREADRLLDLAVRSATEAGRLRAALAGTRSSAEWELELLRRELDTARADLAAEKAR